MDNAVDTQVENTESQVIESAETDTIENTEAGEAKKRGAKPILERADKLKSALSAIEAGAAQEGEQMPSRFIQHRLVEAGLVAFQQVKEEKRRGRPRNVPHLTPAGAVMLESL